MTMMMMIMTVFTVLSSWRSHCESSPSSFDERRAAPSGLRPSQPTWLRIRL